MLRVALTGGLGSGKSTAAAMFAELGCHVSSSDEIARAMMRPGEPVFRSIVQHFGPAVVRADGTLDRAGLAAIAFGQGRAEELNARVHPLVIARQNAWMEQIRRDFPSGVAMVESALIFETRHSARSGENTGQASWSSRFDRVVLVTAPEPVRVDRFVARVLAASAPSVLHGIEALQADARARIDAQMPDADKAALSDFVIENAGSQQELRLRVGEVWQQLRDGAATRAGNTGLLKMEQ